LNMRGVMLPSERRHGLYKVEVFELQGRLRGHYDVVDPQTEGTVVWGEPYLALSVTDVRGIVGTPKVLVNGIEETMFQGAPVTSGWQPNLRVPLHGKTSLKGQVDFTVDLNLAGTETLSMAPVGDSNLLEIRSAWRSPLFGGQFLPRTREVAKTGFHAVWEVSSLASGTQVQLQASPVKAVDLMTVSLTTLLDPYSLSNRAVKYGILFVVLTFGGFFIFELMKHLPIHPIQYLLVGFGLAIFFLLLVSFSEHMPFGAAYLIASIACIGLLTFYLSFVLRSATRGLGFGAMLTSFYAAIYGLLVSEDNALILGSLMLFILLAAVMYVTRNVDWYRGNAEASSGSVAFPVAPPPLSS
jgi:inner membrane protein